MKPFDYWSSGRGLGEITPLGNDFPEGPKFKIWFPDIFFAQDVVEFGCGVGRLAPYFSKRRYTGYDICPDAIEIARARNHGYQFEVIDDDVAIEGGHVGFAHNVLLHIPDDEIYRTIARFRQKRFIVTEVLGVDWRREGDPPVFNREIEGYERPFVAAGYRLHRVQFHPTDYRPKGVAVDIAMLEFHLT